MLSEPRYASIEQALIITKTYQENEDDPKIIQRAKSLKAALEKMEIRVEPEELIVGNRTAGVRYGVVFPESGSTWVDKEFETLPTRPQDRFNVHKKDIYNTKVEGKEPDEIIYFEICDKPFYFWYYENFQSDKAGNSLTIEIQK